MTRISYGHVRIRIQDLSVGEEASSAIITCAVRESTEPKFSVRSTVAAVLHPTNLWNSILSTTYSPPIDDESHTIQCYVLMFHFKRSGSFTDVGSVIGLNWTVGLTPFRGRFEDISLNGMRIILNGPNYFYTWPNIDFGKFVMVWIRLGHYDFFFVFS